MFFDSHQKKIVVAILEIITLLDYDKNREWAENISMVMQLGLTMSGSILFCFFTGRWLDKYSGGSGFFTFLFILFGIVGGGNVCYRQIVSGTNSERD